MKKIVGRKLYDTESNNLELIGEFDRGFIGDLNYVHQELYRIDNDHYIIYSLGGALTSFGDDFSGGDDLDIVTKDEAIDWAIEHMKASDVVAAFPSDIDL